MNLAELKNNLRTIDDEIDNLYDDYMNNDCHFESAKLDKISALEKERTKLINEHLNIFDDENKL